MIINIKHKKDLITIDTRLKEIRFLKDNYKTFNEHLQMKDKDFNIVFIPLSNNDIGGYEYLFNYNYINTLLKCLKSDLRYKNIKISIKDLEVLK